MEVLREVLFFFNTYLFIYIFLTALHSRWDLISLTRDGKLHPLHWKHRPPSHWNHWTTREVPEGRFNEEREEDVRERRKQ